MYSVLYSRTRNTVVVVISHFVCHLFFVLTDTGMKEREGVGALPYIRITCDLYTSLCISLCRCRCRCRCRCTLVDTSTFIFHRHICVKLFLLCSHWCYSCTRIIRIIRVAHILFVFCDDEETARTLVNSYYTSNSNNSTTSTSNRNKTMLNNNGLLILVADCVLPKLYPIEPLIQAIATCIRLYDDENNQNNNNDHCSTTNSTTRSKNKSACALLSYEYRYYQQGYDPKQEFIRLATSHKYQLLVKTVPKQKLHPIYATDDIELWIVTANNHNKKKKKKKKKKELLKTRQNNTQLMHRHKTRTIYEQHE